MGWSVCLLPPFGPFVHHWKSNIFFGYIGRSDLNTCQGKKLGKQPGSCVLCCYSVESVDHLFPYCNFFLTIWRQLCLATGSHETFEGLCMEQRKRKFPEAARMVILMLIGGAVTGSRWREWNNRIFLNKRSSVSSVVAEGILHFFSFWSLVSCCRLDCRNPYLLYDIGWWLFDLATYAHARSCKKNRDPD